MKSVLSILVGLLIAVAAYLLIEFALEEKQEIELVVNDESLVTLGKEIYLAECASCHRADLSGEADWRIRDPQGYLPAPPHDETGHTWHHSDEVLFEITKYGLSGIVGEDYKSKMPAYGDILSDEEIIAVLSYIKSQWPAEIRKRHDAINRRI